MIFRYGKNNAKFEVLSRTRDRRTKFSKTPKIYLAKSNIRGIHPMPFREIVKKRKFYILFCDRNAFSRNLVFCLD